MSRGVPDGHFHVFIFSESKFYAIYNGENHLQIRGLWLNYMFLNIVIRQSALLRKLALNVEDFHVKNHVFDHATRKSVLFPCYILKTYGFFTLLQQIPCYRKSRLSTLRLISWWRVTYMKWRWLAGTNPRSPALGTNTISQDHQGDGGQYSTKVFVEGSKEHRAPYILWIRHSEHRDRSVRKVCGSNILRFDLRMRWDTLLSVCQRQTDR